MFNSELDKREIGEMNGRSVYLLLSPLCYNDICIPAGFQTDEGSVPRLPVIYGIWGDRAHRECVLHDYLFRKGCKPQTSFMKANLIFYQAMKSRNVKFYICYPMFLMVCLFGIFSYNKLPVDYQFFPQVDPIM